MKLKQYIAPETLPINVEAEQFIAVSPGMKLRTKYWMQYDGDPLHQDIGIKNTGQIAGPASEYIGTENQANPVNEDDIFSDDF